MRRHRGRPRRLPDDDDFVWIAASARCSAHPAQRCALVHKAVTAGTAALFSSQLGCARSRMRDAIVEVDEDRAGRATVSPS